MDRRPATDGPIDREILRSCAAALTAAARVALRHAGELDATRRQMLLTHVESTAERLRVALSV